MSFYSINVEFIFFIKLRRILLMNFNAILIIKIFKYIIEAMQKKKNVKKLLECNYVFL